MEVIYQRKDCRNLILTLLMFSVTGILSAQNHQLSDSVTIDECISYAMMYQPLVRQLKLDEQIANRDIKISLSGWLPELNVVAGYSYFIKQPVAIFPNFTDPTGPKSEITTGLRNNSNIEFSASQNIFTNDLLFASKTSRYYRQQIKQTSQKSLIQIVVDINKAFYDILLSEQMLNIINKDIDRLAISLKNATSLYTNGTTDKIDYSRAIIAVNNARSQKIIIVNSIVAKKSFLKQLIGYPEDKPLELKYNYLEMTKDILIDTLQIINYNERIEYQLLQTNLKLQKISMNYYKESFLPSLSGFANYNFVYQNDKFSALYNKSFPNSIVGLSLSLPLFAGTKKWQQIKKAELSYQRLSLDTINLKNSLSTTYVQALSGYKSNLAAYKITRENIITAQDVYNTVMFQYKQGIKTYLDVIISETDLLTAELNNLSSVISLMNSRIDVQQALGKISVNY